MASRTTAEVCAQASRMRALFKQLICINTWPFIFEELAGMQLTVSPFISNTALCMPSHLVLRVCPEKRNRRAARCCIWLATTPKRISCATSPCAVAVSCFSAGLYDVGSRQRAAHGPGVALLKTWVRLVPVRAARLATRGRLQAKRSIGDTLSTAGSRATSELHATVLVRVARC